jgi:hypothetical protein
VKHSSSRQQFSDLEGIGNLIVQPVLCQNRKLFPRRKEGMYIFLSVYLGEFNDCFVPMKKG